MQKVITKSLIIGIGGTGQEIIKEVKKSLFERFNEIPPAIKFLSVDTDERKEDVEMFPYEYLGELQPEVKIDINEGEFVRLFAPDNARHFLSQSSHML